MTTSTVENFITTSPTLTSHTNATLASGNEHNNTNATSVANETTIYHHNTYYNVENSTTVLNVTSVNTIDLSWKTLDLSILRGKTVLFIGDSIDRHFVEWLCGYNTITSLGVVNEGATERWGAEYRVEEWPDLAPSSIHHYGIHMCALKKLDCLVASAMTFGVEPYVGDIHVHHPGIERPLSQLILQASQKIKHVDILSLHSGIWDQLQNMDLPYIEGRHAVNLEEQLFTPGSTIGAKQCLVRATSIPSGDLHSTDRFKSHNQVLRRLARQSGCLMREFDVSPIETFDGAHPLPGWMANEWHRFINLISSDTNSTTL